MVVNPIEGVWYGCYIVRMNGLRIIQRDRSPSINTRCVSQELPSPSRDRPLLQVMTERPEHLWKTCLLESA